jgi:hypothetical protein
MTHLHRRLVAVALTLAATLGSTAMSPVPASAQAAPEPRWSGTLIITKGALQEDFNGPEGSLSRSQSWTGNLTVELADLYGRQDDTEWYRTYLTGEAVYSDYGPDRQCRIGGIVGDTSTGRLTYNRRYSEPSYSDSAWNTPVGLRIGLDGRVYYRTDITTYAEVVTTHSNPQCDGDFPYMEWGGQIASGNGSFAIPLNDDDPDPNHLVGSTTTGNTLGVYDSQTYTVTYDLWRNQPPPPQDCTVNGTWTGRGYSSVQETLLWREYPLGTWEQSARWCYDPNIGVVVDRDRMDAFLNGGSSGSVNLDAYVATVFDSLGLTLVPKGTIYGPVVTRDRFPLATVEAQGQLDLCVDVVAVALNLFNPIGAGMARMSTRLAPRLTRFFGNRAQVTAIVEEEMARTWDSIETQITREYMQRLRQRATATRAFALRGDTAMVRAFLELIMGTVDGLEANLAAARASFEGAVRAEVNSAAATPNSIISVINTSTTAAIDVEDLWVPCTPLWQPSTTLTIWPNQPPTMLDSTLPSNFLLTTRTEVTADSR